jgi:PAS domain S-box-containing protein
MEKTDNPSSNSLRQRAEEIQKSRFPITSVPQNQAETLKLIRKLQLNQIELELQYEELLRAKELEIQHECEEKNSYLFANNPQPMWIYDLETLAFLEVNNAAIHHYNYTREEFLSMTLKDIRPKEDIEKLLKDVELTRKLYNPAGEWRHLKKDGKIIHVEIISHQITYNGRKARHVMINDITERKLAEEAFHKSEERSRHALNHMLEGCQIIGFDWKYIYLNHSAEIHNRRPNEELIGKRYMDVWPGIEETEVFKLIKQTLEKRVSHHLDNKFVFPNGSTGWFDLSIQPVPEGVFILSIDISERKIAENALRESEEKYRLISDNSDDWIYWLSPDGKLNYVSPACERVTGYSPEEFANNPELNHEIVFVSDKERVRQHAMQIKQEDIPHNMEFRIVTKSGEIRWISHTCSPIFSNDGVYKGRRGTNQNITEQRLTEERLRESELRFRKIYEDGPFGMALVNSDFRFIMANVRYCEMLGFEEKELQKLTFKEITTPEDIIVDLPNIKKLIAGEIPVYKTEKRYIRKDGQIIWGSLTVAANYDDNGQFLYNVAILEDITRRKNAEEKIKHLNERISTATRASQVGIWDWDVVNDQLDWDDQMYILYGIKSTGPKAYESWLNGLHPDERKSIDDIIQQAIRGEKEYDTEFRVVWPDGSVHWLKAAGQVFFDENGIPVRMIGVNFDITERKKAEQELRISEERYRNIYESAVIGIYRTSPDGKILMANSTLIKLLGFKSFEELAQRNLEEEGFENEKQRYKFRKNIEKNGSVIGLESVWKRKDGRSVVVNENAKAFYDNSGKVIYYEGTIEDITERKKMERTLRESEEKFRKAFLTNPDSITINRLEDGMYVSVNNGFTQIFGYSEDEILGKLSLEIKMWQNPNERKRFVKELETNRVVENFETKLCAKDGKIIDSLVSAAIMKFDGVPHILSTTRDITERKRAEVILRESEERYRSIFENSSVAILLTSPDGDILSANEFACNMFDRSEEELCKVGRASIVDSADPRLPLLLEERKRTGSVKGELTFIKKDGTRFPCEISSVIFKDMDGNERTSMVIRDMTLQKQAEEEIKNFNLMLEQRISERTAQLEAANKELEAFSYSVSHDLRAPLRHINGFVDLLTEKYQEILPEKGQHYLNVIVDSSRQMGTLIDDLLQFSRTGRQEMQQTNLDMNVVIREVMKLIANDIYDRKIEWNLAVLPILKGDHALIRVVWYNLLNNAVKFTKGKNPAIIEIGYHEEGSEYTFFVRDNGAGFDMKYAHKLFGVFQRLHPKQDFEGTGIGLANVRRIILRHGGRTWAESEVNQGATFYFALPKNKEGEK